MTTQKKADGAGGYYYVGGTGAGTSGDPFVEEVGASLAGDVTASTEYTEGDTDASITGGVVMWEDTSDTIRAVSAAKPLPVGDAGGSLTIDNAALTSMDAKLPALGQALAAASVPVVLTAAQITTLTPPAAITGFATSAKQDTGNTSVGNIDTNLGAAADTAASADTGTFSLIAIAKRMVAKLTSIIAKQPALGTAGTASADVITVQGIASMTALSVTDTRLPTALGASNASGCLPVTLANDGVAATLLGAVTETAPATDTASSGINGRIQRACQRLTSLIALVPAALGQGTMAQSFRVVIASDQATFPVTATVALPTTIYNGKKTVTTAGTRVTLASSQAVVSGVSIKALAANTGTIYVGDGSVASTTGYALAPGDVVFLEIANLSTVNLDSSVNGEGVTYIAS